TTRRRPTRRAARTFSLIPPTGKTSPLRVISPVMAVSPRTGTLAYADASAVAIATPAHHEAALNHLAGLEGAPLFTAIAALSMAAALGHPCARRWAQTALLNRPAGPEVPHTSGALLRSHVVDLSDLTPQEQVVARSRLKPFPRLAGTTIVVAPLGTD